MAEVKKSQFHKILFPVDMSPMAYATVPYVKEMAITHGAVLTLMHVVQPSAPWYPSDGGAPLITYDLDELLALSDQRLSEFKDRNFGDLPPSILVDEVNAQGDPALSIIDYSRRNQVDLIMMPTHGFGLFRSFLLGSVTAKVLHDVDCSVWTGMHVEDKAAKEHFGIKSVLCAIDLQPASAQLILQSLELSAKHAAQLRLVHSVPGTDASPDKYLYFDAEFERRMMLMAREQIAEIQRTTKTNLEVCIAGGPVSKVVRSAALHHNADLVVIGRGMLHAALGRLRSNSYSIIRDSPCAVISF